MSGDALPSEVDIAIQLSDWTIPTTDLGDGSVASVHVESWCGDRADDGGFMLRPVSLTAVQDGASGGFTVPESSPMVQIAFDPTGVPPGPGQPNDDCMLYAQDPVAGWMLAG